MNFAETKQQQQERYEDDVLFVAIFLFFWWCVGELRSLALLVPHHLSLLCVTDGLASVSRLPLTTVAVCNWPTNLSRLSVDLTGRILRKVTCSPF